MRSGIGFDAHRFDEDRPLVLGGVRFEGETGLAGHSDADVLAHAVIDAVLGAAGLGDIGDVFPSSDARWKDASSIEMLATVAGMVQGEQLRVVSVDAVVVAERPRLADRRGTMRATLAAALGVSESRISVKATTTDGMGFTGRGEGIAAIATALVDEA